MNVQEAKTHLSRLLDDAVRGDEIVIAKAGRPYVRLVPCREEDSPRPLGGWKGRVEIAADFDRTPEAVVALFDGPDKPQRPTKSVARRRP